MPKKFYSMKSIIKAIEQKERNQKNFSLYKNLFINHDEDSKRLLHISLMEFMKKKKNNYRPGKPLDLSPNKTTKFINTNDNFWLPFMRKKTWKNSTKIIGKKEYSNVTPKPNINIDTRNNLKSACKSDRVGVNFLVKEETKNNSKNRIFSCMPKERFKNSGFEKRPNFDLEPSEGRKINSNNNTIYIRNVNNNIMNEYNIIPYSLKKNTYMKNFNYYNNNNFVQEENKNRPDNVLSDPNKFIIKNSLIKKNKSLPNLNISELKEMTKNRNNIMVVKDKMRNLMVNSVKPRKRVVEYIYDNNINVKYHFKSIKFGMKKNKNKDERLSSNSNNVNMNSNNINSEQQKEEIIVRPVEKVKTKSKDPCKLNMQSVRNSNKKNYEYNKTSSTCFKLTEENKINMIARYAYRNRIRESNSENSPA